MSEDAIDEEDSNGATTGEPTEDDHPALPEEDLNYPTLTFDEGTIADDGGFELSTATDHDEMSAPTEDLAGALASHDLAVASEDDVVTFGVGPRGVDVSFDPDEDHRGELEVTFRLSAKAMLVADDSEVVGSRSDTGFVPLSMLEEDDSRYRCYSWITDPENPD